MMTRQAPIALAVFALIILSGCGTMELQHELTEQDANEIYVLLNENGISVQKMRDEGGGNEVRYKILVEQKDAAQSTKLMREYSLPRPMSGGFTQVIKNKGMIPTAVEERAMLLDAVAGEVSNAINKVDGVLEARVIVQIPEKNDLSQPDKKPTPTASAFIRYRPTMEGKPPIDSHLVALFVSTAVEDLKPDNVTVVMSEARLPSADTNPGTRIVDVFGLRMAASSIGSFKTYAITAMMLIFAMAGFCGWTFLRGTNLLSRRKGAPEA